MESLEGTAVPPMGVARLTFDPPSSWQGMDVVWTTVARPELVYLKRFSLSRTESADAVHVLAARYDLDDALVGGDSLGGGHFIEYFVAEEGRTGPSPHRLLQTMSITYSSSDEDSDYVPAAAVSDPARLSLDQPPVWRASEAVWPTAAGEPMTFVGQVELPDTELTRRLLTWDVSVFLFMSCRAPTGFKIVEQPSDFQSAEEHYEDEGA